MGQSSTRTAKCEKAAANIRKIQAYLKKLKADAPYLSRPGEQNKPLIDAIEKLEQNFQDLWVHVYYESLDRPGEKS